MPSHNFEIFRRDLTYFSESLRNYSLYRVILIFKLLQNKFAGVFYLTYANKKFFASFSAFFVLYKYFK